MFTVKFVLKGQKLIADAANEFQTSEAIKPR